MTLDYPHVRPTRGDVITTHEGRVIRIAGRADQPNGQDYFEVEDDGERREMHIDELSEVLNSSTFTYCRGGQ